MSIEKQQDQITNPTGRCPTGLAWKRSASLLAFLALFVLTQNLNAQNNSPVPKLRTELRTSLLKLWEPFVEINLQYTEAVQQLREQAAAKSDLALLEAINQELATYQQLDSRQYPEFPKLQLLRNFYEKRRAELDANHRRSQLAVLEIYKDQYDQLKAVLITDNRIEESVAAQRQIGKIEAAIEDQAEVSELMALWSLENVTDVVSEKETEIDRKNGNFVISSKAKFGGMIRSSESFKTPYEIQMRIATDSTNIRIYIGRRLLTIFNWEVRPSELRVHDPTPGTNTKIPVKGMGYLEADEMHDIRIRVESAKIWIMANGELRFLFEGDFSNLDGDVGVGPGFNSILTIKRFDVMPLINL